MNLGIRFWMFGGRVLIIDLDQQGNLSKSLGFPRGDYSFIQDVLEGKTKIQDAIKTVEDDLHVTLSKLNNVHNNQYMQAYNISPDAFSHDHWVFFWRNVFFCLQYCGKEIWWN